MEQKIFQMNKRSTISNSSLDLFQRSWKLCNPQFEYTFFNQENCENFIRQYASEEWNLYSKIKDSQNKAIFVDWFRFLYIYIVGGIYTDIDTICLKSFIHLYQRYSDKKMILGYDIDVGSYEEARSMGRVHTQTFSTHTFIACSRNPIIKRFLDKYSEVVMQQYIDINTVPFGNNLFTDIVYQYPNFQNEVAIVSVKTFSNGLHIPHSGCNSIRNNPESFSTHFAYSSWYSRDIVPFSRNCFGSGNFHCGNCNRLNGTFQDSEHAEFYKNINKSLFSLYQYIPREDELDIFLITKNNQDYFKKIFPSIMKCLNERIKTNWLIYENGSTDNTKKMLKQIFDFSFHDQECSQILNHHNLVKCNCFSKGDKVVLDNYEPSENDFSNKENLNYIHSREKQDVVQIGLRCEKIAWAREKLMELEVGNNNIGKGMAFPKWCLLIDSDVIFDYENTIKPLISAARDNPNGVMFCANGQCVSGDLDDLYYDTFALDYGIYIWDNKAIEYLNNKFGGSNVCSVKTAFGGVALIRKEVLNYSSWSTYCEEAKKWKGYKAYGMSEHYSFCEEVRRFGEIYIVKNAVSHWLQDHSYTNTKQTIPSLIEEEAKAVRKKGLLKGYLKL